MMVTDDKLRSLVSSLRQHSEAEGRVGSCCLPIGLSRKAADSINELVHEIDRLRVGKDETDKALDQYVRDCAKAFDDKYLHDTPAANNVYHDPPRDLGENLGLAQQCWHMAQAACRSLRMKFDETSPSEITGAIARLWAKVEAFEKLMVVVSHNGNGDTQEIPATPDSLRAYIDELQSEWDAEARKGYSAK